MALFPPAYVGKLRAYTRNRKKEYVKYRATRSPVSAQENRDRRAGDTAAENVAYAGRKVGELEEEYDAMLREHDEQRERFRSEHHDDY